MESNLDFLTGTRKYITKDGSRVELFPLVTTGREDLVIGKYRGICRLVNQEDREMTVVYDKLGHALIPKDPNLDLVEGVISREK